MSNLFLLIKQLTKSIPQQAIKVRVIRLWRELMYENLNENANYTAVFMDEQGDKIQGCVDNMFIEEDRQCVRWDWKSVRYGVSKGLDTTYWSFLEDSRIQCTLFNYYKHELMSLIGTDMHCSKILIIQFGTVFKIDGIVKVRNLKAATRLFLNGDVPENHAYIKRYRVKVTVFDEHTKTSTFLILLDHQITQIVTKYTHVPKIVSRISDDPALISVFNDIVASHSVSADKISCNFLIEPLRLPFVLCILDAYLSIVLQHQVVLDAIALTPCYPAFLITADVPEICPRVPGRDFDPLPSEEDTMSFLRELSHTREINSLNDVVVDQMHQPWRTFAALINRGLSGKTIGLDKLCLSRAQILWVKRPAKKSTTKPTAGVVIREAPVETRSKSKEKEKVDVTLGKGIELLYEVALTEEAQMKEVRKKSLRDFHKTHPSGSGTVVEKPPSVDKSTPTITSEGTSNKPGVPDVTEDDSTKSESEFWGNDEDDSNNDQDSGNEHSEQENESEEQVSDSEQEEESEDDDQEEEDDDVNKSDEESDDVIKGDKEIVQGEGADDEMIDTQQGNENLKTTQEQVIEDSHVTISTVTNKTEVPVTSSSCSSDLASKFLIFLDIPHTDAEIVSPLDVHYTQSSQIFTPPPPLATPTPPPTIETTNPLSTLPDFASVFRFNDRITSLEKEVAELKKDPLHTQVTTLVDEHLETRLGETREEFMNFLLESLTARIKEQVKDQLPQILHKEVSNFAPPVIEALIKESRDEVNLEKILIDKMEKSESYLAAPEHRDCYDSLKKSYDLDKDFFFSYDVYSLKRSRKDKDKDEDPSAGSDRGLKKRKLSKDAEPTTGLKKKDSTSGSSKGTKSQPKSSRKSVQSEEPVFEVADSNMPQDQEGNLGDNKDELRNETASRLDCFKKPTPPQKPTDPDWYVGKTTQEGPTQNWLMTLAASTSIDKSLKYFDELMSTPIDFSGYILNGLKIKNLTQEILLGPAFKLLKDTRSNFIELEYDFEECYKALSEKLDWENPEGGDYPFDLSKPLPLITRGKRQRVPFEYFINNDLKYLQGGVSTMTYTTSTTKTKAAQYDLPGIEDMVPNIWSLVKVSYDRYVLWVTHVKVMRKYGYGYLKEIAVRRVDNVLYRFKEGDFPRLRINDIADMLILVDLQLRVESYQKKINVTKPDTTRPDLKKGTRTLHTKIIKDSFMLMTTRGIVLAEEKMEHIGKEISSFHDQGHQQATKGKEDDEEFGEICWRYTLRN
ncbi:hypothetical protein Tco_0564370 [Tanacetum coccineum]